MKKLFITSYVRLYGASKRQARKAWKTCDEGTMLAVIGA